MTDLLPEKASAGATVVDQMVDAVPGTLWEKLLEDPARAPEHIALAAAKRFADPALEWVAAHPGMPPAELARLAVRRHVRMARYEGAALGTGGALTVAPDLAALAWIQSRMTYFVAASYGFDPHHEMRPAELLALHEFFETPAEAKASLDGLGAPLASAYVANRMSRESSLVRQLAGFLGRRLARRMLGRFIPFVSVPISAMQNSRATAELGRKAILYYGGDSGGYRPKP
jgi:hypothetical protein